MELSQGDLERELQRVLRTRGTALPVTDPVGAVHSGMRRRRRAQRVQVLSAGLAVVAVAVVAALVGNPLSSSVAPPTPATQGPSPRPPSDLRAVPEGFEAQDLSFVGTDQGWSLGTVPCGTERCTVQLVTTDGGATWVRRPAVGLPRTCMASACVSRVRFATARIGYAFGPSLYLTDNGGSTWSRFDSGEVQDLEIAGDQVARVVSTRPGCLPECTFAIQTAAVGSIAWRTTHTTTEPRLGAALVRRGTRLVAQLYGTTDGEASTATGPLVLSDDGGATWRVRADPCVQTAVPGSGTSNVALGSDGVVVLLCQGDPGQAAVRLSTDSGRTFGPARSVPGRGQRLAAAGADRVVVEAVRGERPVLQLTRDGGRSWTQVAVQTQPYGVAYGSYLAFATSAAGTWLSPDGTGVWTTSDGGESWTRRPFRSG